MINLDWTKINEFKIFQRLVNHLFSLECNSPGFIPSSPDIGADGGWDGFFDGYYPKENISGRFCIQAKWTKHTLTDAVKTLEGEIKGKGKDKGEYYKAIENKVNHLRIATNAELTVDRDIIKSCG